MNHVYLITGSNLGDRNKQLDAAAHFIGERIGRIIKSSSVYETEAWGNTNQPSFYNQVHLIETAFDAPQMMNKILAIEEEMGRIRTVKNAARIIDIDILFFNDQIISSDSVTVPHKEICNRNFVLEPLKQIAPQFIHPQAHKTISELLDCCPDHLIAKPLKQG